MSPISTNTSGDDLPLIFSRPKLADLEGLTGKGSNTLLFVCGPRGMVDAAEHHAHDNGWDFHTETFEL